MAEKLDYHPISFLTPVISNSAKMTENFTLGRQCENFWNFGNRRVVKITTVSTKSINNLGDICIVETAKKQKEPLLVTILKVTALVLFFPFFVFVRCMYRCQNKFIEKVDTEEKKKITQLDLEEDIKEEKETDKPAQVETEEPKKQLPTKSQNPQKQETVPAVGTSASQPPATPVTTPTSVTQPKLNTPPSTNPVKATAPIVPTPTPKTEASKTITATPAKIDIPTSPTQQKDPAKDQSSVDLKLTQSTTNINADEKSSSAKLGDSGVQLLSKSPSLADLGKIEITSSTTTPSQTESGVTESSSASQPQSTTTSPSTNHASVETKNSTANSASEPIITATATDVTQTIGNNTSSQKTTSETATPSSTETPSTQTQPTITSPATSTQTTPEITVTAPTGTSQQKQDASTIATGTTPSSASHTTTNATQTSVTTTATKVENKTDSSASTAAPTTGSAANSTGSSSSSPATTNGTTKPPSPTGDKKQSAATAQSQSPAKPAATGSVSSPPPTSSTATAATARQPSPTTPENSKSSTAAGSNGGAATAGNSGKLSPEQQNQSTSRGDSPRPGADAQKSTAKKTNEAGAAALTPTKQKTPVDLYNEGVAHLNKQQNKEAEACFADALEGFNQLILSPNFEKEDTKVANGILAKGINCLAGLNQLAQKEKDSVRTMKDVAPRLKFYKKKYSEYKAKLVAVSPNSFSSAARPTSPPAKTAATAPKATASSPASVVATTPTKAPESSTAAAAAATSSPAIAKPASPSTSTATTSITDVSLSSNTSSVTTDDSNNNNSQKKKLTRTNSGIIEREANNDLLKGILQKGEDAYTIATQPDANDSILVTQKYSEALKHFGHYISEKYNIIDSKEKDYESDKRQTPGLLAVVEKGLNCLQKLGRIENIPMAGQFKVFRQKYIDYKEKHEEIDETKVLEKFKLKLEKKITLSKKTVTPQNNATKVDYSNGLATGVSLKENPGEIISIINIPNDNSNGIPFDYAISTTTGYPNTDIRDNRMENRSLVNTFQIRQPKSPPHGKEIEDSDSIEYLPPVDVQIFAVFDGFSSKVANSSRPADVSYEKHCVQKAQNELIKVLKDKFESKCSMDIVDVKNVLKTSLGTLSNQIGMSSSATSVCFALVFHDKKAKKDVIWTANLGNTRVVIIKNDNSPAQLSTDAVYRNESNDPEGSVDKKFATAIRLRGAQLSESTSESTDETNKIAEHFSPITALRYLGNFEGVKGISRRPEVMRYEISSQEKLVLATRGTWDVINSEEIPDTIYGHKLDKATNEIVKKAVQRGIGTKATKNNTVIVVDLNRKNS